MTEFPAAAITWKIRLPLRTSVGLAKFYNCGKSGFPPLRRNSRGDAQSACAGEGVSIGAHPGFNDIWGFGRRRIDIDPREVEYMIAYQIGALQAMACYDGGAKVTHLKPHGSLNNVAAENIDLALAIGRAIKTVDCDIIDVALAGSQMERAGRGLGCAPRAKAFATGFRTTTAT